MKKLFIILLLTFAFVSAQVLNRYALIDSENVVNNIIVYDGDDPYKLPSGWLLVRLTNATLFVEVGCLYNRTTRAFACPSKE